MAAKSSSATQQHAADTVQSKGIDYGHVEESDEALTSAVFSFNLDALHPFIRKMSHPTMEPDGVELLDPLDRKGSYYLSTGGLGRPHLQLASQINGRLSDFLPVPLEGLWSSADSIELYQTRRPYTLLSYHGSIHSDNQLNIAHTQNITSRWNYALHFDLISRDGVYTQSGVNNRQLDVSTNYYSVSSRYQLRAGVVRQNFLVEENGGLADDNVFLNNSTTNRSGIPVRMYDAANQWRSTEVFVVQTYNTVNLFDTISPHKANVLNSGVFGADLRFSKLKRNFFDNSVNSENYQHFYFSTVHTYDSTACYKASATLFWTNDAYPLTVKSLPLKLTAGAKPTFYATEMCGMSSRWTTVDPFAMAELDFGVLQICIKDERRLGGNAMNGDHFFDFVSTVKTGVRSKIELVGHIESAAPQWFFRSCNSNNFRWENSFEKTTVANGEWAVARTACADSLHDISGRLAMCYEYRNHDVYLTNLLVPYQTSLSARRLALQLNLNARAGWFHYNGLHLIQNTSNSEIIPVPTFATKNSFYADFTLFHNALRMQCGIDLRYHTRYNAPGYCAALGTFYHQNETLVGGYVWTDAFVTLKIKQADIYLKGVHLNAPLEKNPSYFLLPHYPGEDLGVYWGIAWRFFN